MTSREMTPMEMAPMGRVSGKVALVSGGARGLGASHVRRLAEEGASVVFGDILDQPGAELEKELGDSVRYVHLDVTRFDDWVAAVVVATECFGQLDILVNNAGINIRAPIEDYTLEAWDSTIAVNLTGVFYGIKAVIPSMMRARSGSIINISSTAGLVGLQGVAAYNASKFGVRGLTKNAAIDLGKYNIRVNSVHPGAIDTPMNAGHDMKQERVALHRVGSPREVSHLVLYLASDESSFSTGSEFVVDGGETAGVSL
jgi:3alpha(or 20beta)-hydroxysteroid dehydrogenase